MTMRIRSAKRHVQEGAKNLFRNRLMSLASIITVSACSFIFIISFCLLINLNYILKQIESTIGISVFIQDDLSAKDVESLMQEISKIPHVTAAKYISADEALAKVRNQWGNPNIFVGIENDNPLPRSFELSLDGAKYQGSVIQALDAFKGKGVENIRHAKEESDFLLALNTGLRVSAVVLIVVLGAISIAIIMNTIKITVYIRKNEINIMKYVGATHRFILWPFVVEGVIIGLIGSAIPVILCFMGYDKSVSIIYEKLFVIQNLVKFKSGAEVFSVVMPVTLIIGTLIGTIGSVTSIRKYLKV